MLSNTQSSISGEQYNQLSEVYGTEYIELFQGVDKVRLEKAPMRRTIIIYIMIIKDMWLELNRRSSIWLLCWQNWYGEKINNGAFENGEEIIIVISDDILSDNMTSIYSDDAPKSILKQMRRWGGFIKRKYKSRSNGWGNYCGV